MSSLESREIKLPLTLTKKLRKNPSKETKVACSISSEIRRNRHQYGIRTKHPFQELKQKRISNQYGCCLGGLHCSIEEIKLRERTQVRSSIALIVRPKH